MSDDDDGHWGVSAREADLATVRGERDPPTRPCGLLEATGGPDGTCGTGGTAGLVGRQLPPVHVRRAHALLARLGPGPGNEVQQRGGERPRGSPLAVYRGGCVLTRGVAVLLRDSTPVLAPGGTPTGGGCPLSRRERRERREAAPGWCGWRWQGRWPIRDLAQGPAAWRSSGVGWRVWAKPASSLPLHTHRPLTVTFQHPREESFPRHRAPGRDTGRQRMC